MPREKAMNVAEFERALGESGLDVLVAASPWNVFYTSGALIATQTYIRDRLALTVMPKKGDDALLVCDIEASLAKHESWIEDVRSYVEGAQSPVSLLADVLEEKRLAEGRVGIEKRYLTSEYHEELVEALPKATIEACDSLLDEVRSIKTEGEIERFQQAALATERALVEAFREARAGQTEKELQQSILINLFRLGSSRIRFVVFAVGDQGVHVHPQARERELRPGDLVRVDTGGVFNGYGSDVARMAVVGEPTDLQRDLYRKHWEVQRKAIGYMRPGVRACDVFEYCARVYSDFGLDFRLPHVGHCFGLRGHETPILQPYDTQELRANMLICIEPVYLDKNVGSFQIEDLVLIKEGGAELLTTYADTEELFVID